jgi:WD40 repeat protein
MKMIVKRLIAILGISLCVTTFLDAMERSKIFKNKQDLRLWLFEHIKPSCTLHSGNAGFVKCAALNAAKDRMITLMCKDPRVQCYNPLNGNLLWNYASDQVPSRVSCNKQGNRIVVTFNRWGCATLLDGQTGAMVATLKAYQNPETTDEALREVLCAAFNLEGSQLALGSRAREVSFWNAQDGQMVGSYEVHSGAVQCVNYDATGKLLASGSDDTSVQLVQIDLAHRIASYLGHKHPVHTVSFSDDGSKLVSGGADKSALIWDIATQKILLKLKHKFSVEHASLSPDSAVLAVSDGAHVTALWDIRQSQMVDKFLDRDMTRDQYVLLEEMRKANLAGQNFQLDSHPLKQVWPTIPGDVSGLVSNYTKTDECDKCS